MYLKSIKLSGFKTFVEPTLIVTSSRLVGIVGPNGCGKSNVIDSVRWVLGESRASALRGQSLQDVIFSGSETRRSVSRASVELVFNNQSERLSGPWGQYAEISLKRVISRSGDSVYSINGQVVRRRDVIDTFLGTGMGAYAIIEQGMVSRLIESKPEEVRLFLEEAADISRYRERRRETEQKLMRTEENLQRVQDILNELARTLQSLTEEAQLAFQYEQLVKELDGLQHQMWGVETNQAEKDNEKLQSSLGVLERSVAELEERIDGSHASYLQLKDKKTELSSTVSQAQKKCFDIAQSLLQIESDKKHTQEKIASLEQQKLFLSEKRKATETRLSSFDADDSSLAEQLCDMQSQCDQMSTHYQKSLEEQDVVKEEWDREEGVFSDLETTIQKWIQEQELLCAEQKAALHQIEDWSTRLEKEKNDLAHVPVFDQDMFCQREQQRNDYATLFSRLSEEMDSYALKKQEKEEERLSLMAQKEEWQKKIVASQACCDLLCEQQKSAEALLSFSDWLNDESVRPLWHILQINSGWQKALEVVLNYFLEAFFWEDRDSFFNKSQMRPHKRVTAFLPAASLTTAIHENSLLHQIRFLDDRFVPAVTDLLSDVLCVETKELLFSVQKELKRDQIAVTPDGDIATPHTISLYGESESDGILVRQSEIEKLQYVMSQDQCQMQSVIQNIENINNDIVKMDQTALSLAGKKKEIDILLHDVAVEQAKCEEKKLFYNEKKEQCHHMIEESRKKSESWALVQEQCALQLSEIKEKIVQGEEKKKKVDQKRCALRTCYLEKKTLCESFENKKKELGFSIASAKQKKEQLKIMKEELVRICSADLCEYDRCVQLSSELRNHPSLICDSHLIVSQKKEAEEELHAASVKYDLHSKELLSCEEQINKLRLEKDKKYAAWTKEKLNAQRCSLVLEQLLLNKKEHWPAFEEPDVLKSVVLSEVSAAIKKKQAEIGSLGYVNQAASEKLEEEKKRYDFLFKQSEDLHGAVKTLKDAIAQIDEVSRQRLQSTFDLANEQLAQIFPRLFGGGHARFVWLGDDILSSGIDIVACPPGKKNTSIYLLSGGEKALTALSIILSLFQLNPAPFCLLDEVDAPLDEVNTIRLGQLIQEMSGVTQFLFVTHSKVFMEIAQQLVGVTMQEFGISRIVEVGLQDAVEISKEFEKDSGREHVLP